MSAVRANAYTLQSLNACLLLALLAGIAATPASAQVVPTLSPPVFNTPLYQNPFYFPGSTPLIPPIGTPVAPSIDVLSPSNVPSANNRIENSADTPEALPGIDTLTIPVSHSVPSNEQFTAPRIEQMALPADASTVALGIQQRANPKNQQLTLQTNSTPGVGAQPLSQIRTAPPVLGSRRLNTNPENAIELTRARLARQGAWSMTGSARTAPFSTNFAEPTPHATALESSSYTKLDPLSPEVLAEGRAFHADQHNGMVNSPLQKRSGDIPATNFAFHPALVTSLHTTLPKPTQLRNPSTTAASTRFNALPQPLKSSALSRQQPSLPNKPGINLGNHGDLNKLP